MKFTTGGAKEFGVWKPWFAWYPVRFGDFRTCNTDGSVDWVWLEKIQRCRLIEDRYGDTFWSYKP